MSDQPSDKLNFHTRLRSLSPADGIVLDAVLEARSRDLEPGYTGPMPADSAQRAQRIESILSVLGQYPLQEPADDLAERTMARLRESRQRERFAEQVAMLRGPRPSTGASWRQVVAAAAVFLLGFSLLLPTLERNRQESQRLVGASHLASAGMGFGQYAQDNGDALPRRYLTLGSPWWNVGQAITHENQPVESNSAHLYLLVRRGYVSPETLSHPANASAPLPGQMTRQHQDWLSPEQVSYSYQSQYRRDPFSLTGNGSLVLLADRNPIFVVRIGRVVQDTNTPLDAPSRVYGDRGQNILTADGAVTFTRRPVAPRGSAAGDLIWGARGVESYSGTEQPTDANDVFLVP
ncbi:MAG: hypothetical protein IT445_12005 [Phycisphaeraceae bacterium]|nr:hypothetical protein [Phycisphaeraceae bacterium]